MKILYICSDFPKPSKGSNLYTDLAEELAIKGHELKVVVSEEKKHIVQDEISEERGISVLRVKTGNIYEVGFIEKTLTFITISQKLKNGIKKYFSNEKFDLILFQSPPVTFHQVVKWAMKKYNCKSYLMMKDIFPQNGVDIGLYGKLHPAYLFFRYHEKRLYKTASYIGCMSQGNVEYLINHNYYLDKNKFKIFPNTVKIKNDVELTERQRKKIRDKYTINTEDVVAVFGGNFGKPQGLDFLLEVIEEYKANPNLKFLLIGRGTEKEKIFNYIKEKKLKNVLMYDYIPREDYKKILLACDIGLIFLDRRFTIPNYPSKTLSYFECSLPIMAAIDLNTDYGKDIEKIQAGFWCENGNLKNYKEKFDKLIKDKKLRQKMGENGNKYLKKELNVENSVKLLEKHIKGEIKNV